jgi:SAM-dependent methyltransferase
MPNHRTGLKAVADWLRIRSLNAALQQQGMQSLLDRLRTIIPDISQQYSSHDLDTELLELETRALHVFQMKLVDVAMNHARREGGAQVTLVDIGDSSGAHIRYVRAMHGEIRALSVNVDADAVAKIRAKGLEAVHASAEEVERFDIRPDIVLCFETLEHLSDPAQFLRAVATITTVHALAITVPFVRTSRIGLRYIRRSLPAMAGPETTHVFELAPKDWRPLFMFSGWRVEHESILKLYPAWHPMAVTMPLWRTVDFEGFYGAILVPDPTWNRQYRHPPRRIARRR